MMAGNDRYLEWLNALVRPAVLHMKAYSSARHEAEGVKAGIFLDANELHYTPSGSDPELELNLYGDPQPEELLARLGKLYGVSPSNLLVGRGSDEGIELITRTFCRENIDSVLICPPAFGMYKVSAEMQGTGIISVPLNPATGYQHDVAAILAASTPETKVIFLSTPHAPMGHAINREDILVLCKARHGLSIVVADEAYVEFGPDPQGMVPYLNDNSNLVVLRTMSKAHMLAGERIGSVLAHPAIIGMIRKSLTAYPLPRTSVQSAIKALSPDGLRFSAQCRAIAASERDRLAIAFSEHVDVIRVFPSITNFLFMEVRDPKAVMAKAKAAGIVLRDRSGDLPNCIRISVGTPREDDELLKAFGLYRHVNGNTI